MCVRNQRHRCGGNREDGFGEDEMAGKSEGHMLRKDIWREDEKLMVLCGLNLS